MARHKHADPGPRPVPAPRRSFPGAALAEPRGRLISGREVADRLGFHPGTIRNWVAKGKIEFVKVGNRTRFYESTIDRMIATNTFPVVDE